MSDLQKWYDWTRLLRSWGYKVVEMPGCYGKNNGLDWDNGFGPEASLDHHFGSSLNPSQAYIDGLVNMLKDGYATGGGGFLPGPVVNRFVDMNGVIYLIATGPANHAGQGASSVLNRIRTGKAPLGSAASVGAVDDGVKNHNYVGTETQHPGDGTPYPDALINSLVAVNAADCMTWGFSHNAVIQHFESTSRKVDMSYLGGVTGVPGPGAYIRSKVGDFIYTKTSEIPTPTPSPTPIPILEATMPYPVVSYSDKFYALTPFGLTYLLPAEYNAGLKVKLFTERVEVTGTEWSALNKFVSNTFDTLVTTPKFTVSDAWNGYQGKPTSKVVSLKTWVTDLYNFVTRAMRDSYIVANPPEQEGPSNEQPPPNGS
jgi:hypothetical protein